MTNKKSYTSISTRPVATNLDMVVAYCFFVHVIMPTKHEMMMVYEKGSAPTMVT